MKIKSLALLGAIALSTVSYAAYATGKDMTINNNSDAVATASAGVSPCSGSIGDRGIIKPHSNVVIPSWAVGMYCTSDCKAQVYISKNCSGKSIATVTANVRDGVKKIENHDVDGYQVVGSGFNMSIEGAAHKKWYQLLF